MMARSRPLALLAVLALAGLRTANAQTACETAIAALNASITDNTTCANANPANTATTCASSCQTLFTTANSTCAGNTTAWNTARLAGITVTLTNQNYCALWSMTNIGSYIINTCTDRYMYIMGMGSPNNGGQCNATAGAACPAACQSLINTLPTNCYTMDQVIIPAAVVRASGVGFTVSGDQPTIVAASIAWSTGKSLSLKAPSTCTDPALVARPTAPITPGPTTPAPPPKSGAGAARGSFAIAGSAFLVALAAMAA